MEALQNATKHARGATWVRIALSTNGRLRFTVRDDGAGFEPGRVGHRTGLAHMEDRVAAVGGELTIDSAPGRGTRVTGTVPLQ
jgi:signal transduction histidine kinase